MKYIPADKLIAEIERLLARANRRTDKEHLSHNSEMEKFGEDYWNGYGDLAYSLLGFITSLQKEQPEQDITEFEKALDSFGEAYSTLVDRDNNPNQGIRINAYHELVQESINDILSLAKEYVKQEQPEVDLDKLVNEEFASRGQITEYGPKVIYNRAELSRFIKRMAIVFNARKEDKI